MSSNRIESATSAALAQGEFDPVRFADPIVDPDDPLPEISDADYEATRTELAELRRRRTSPAADAA